MKLLSLTHKSQTTRPESFPRSNPPSPRNSAPVRRQPMNILQHIRQFWGNGGLNKLASRDNLPATFWERIGWWEARRVPYNLIVGCAGMITCAFAVIAALAADI